jgi:ribonuclease HI
VHRVQRWARPPEGFLKVNCDASLIPGELRGGWGFLIRENDGEVVLNGWGRVNHLLNAF